MIGCGGVGLQVIAGLRLHGVARIIAVDLEPEHLERALRRGATDAVDASGGDAVKQVRKLTDGGVEHAFEVVGSPVTIRQAWDMLAPGGTATIVGLAPRGAEVSLPAIEFLKEKTIAGSYYGSSDVRLALRGIAQLVQDGRLNLEEVISDLIGLVDVESALDRLRRGGHGARSVILIDEALAGHSRGAPVAE